jgi:hypothetical protein
MKKPDSCPFCEAEVRGSSSWGINPQRMEELRQEHIKEHCETPSPPPLQSRIDELEKGLEESAKLSRETINLYRKVCVSLLEMIKQYKD